MLRPKATRYVPLLLEVAGDLSMVFELSLVPRKSRLTLRTPEMFTKPSLWYTNRVTSSLAIIFVQLLIQYGARNCKTGCSDHIKVHSGHLKQFTQLVLGSHCGKFGKVRPYRACTPELCLDFVAFRCPSFSFDHWTHFLFLPSTFSETCSSKPTTEPPGPSSECCFQFHWEKPLINCLANLRRNSSIVPFLISWDRNQKPKNVSIPLSTLPTCKIKGMKLISPINSHVRCVGICNKQFVNCNFVAVLFALHRSCDAIGEIFVDRNETSHSSWHLVKRKCPRWAWTISPCLSLFFACGGKPFLVAHAWVFWAKGNPWYCFQWKCCQKRYACVCAEMVKPC